MDTLPPIPLRLWLLTLGCAAAFGLLWWSVLGRGRAQRRRMLQQRLAETGDAGPAGPLPLLLPAQASDALHPHLLVIGDAAANVPGLLAAGGGQPVAGDAGQAGAPGWKPWVLPALTAIVSDPALLQQAPGPATRRAWLRGLMALAAQRPALPLNGIVVCVDAASLSRPAPPALAALPREAALLLRLDLPLYLVVTGLEHLPGHAEVCAALPPAVRAQVLGHRLPEQLAAGSTADERLAAVLAPLALRLQALAMALQRDQPEPAVRLAIDRWAQQLLALQPGLHALAAQWPAPPAGGVHWRGIYLTAAATAAVPQGAFVADLVLRFLPEDQALARTVRGAG